MFYLPSVVVFGTACGLGYMALNMAYGQVMLSEAKEELGEEQIDALILIKSQWIVKQEVTIKNNEEYSFKVTTLQ